ncbi:MAG: hypothetical protein JW812_03770 [Alphaproteobacteria bacterium]|nr:hypothetical protein [Alphaproteobacteria bacterium]MBN2779985.1 hypothetical protein [Alphaproteobacteria bacterium]
MKTILLFFFLALTGCQTIDYIVFGEGIQTVTVKPKADKVPEDKTIKTTTFKKDYYGYPIFQMELDNQNEQFESALYYALKQSGSRTQQTRYRLVGWTKDKSTSGTVKDIKRKMMEWGIPEDHIYVKTHKAFKSQKHSQIRLYER